MKRHKALQLFSDAYLEQCKLLTPEQILNFLEEFRELIGSTAKKEEDTGGFMIDN